VVARSRTGRRHVVERLPLKLVLTSACMAMCLVPGDAVANARGVGAPGNGSVPQQGPGRASASEQTRLLLSDMSAPSERLPQGVPTWFDWARHPRARPIDRTAGFRAFTAWGQLYQCAGTPASPDAGVYLKDMQAWVLLRSSHHWRRIQFSSDIAGASFAEDYAGPTLPGRYWPSSTGTSARLISGRNFHFWPSSGRVSLDGTRVAAVTVALEARLVAATDHAATPPCLVLSVGGDMWTSVTATPGGSASSDVGIGRFKRVERRWRLFTMTTAPASVLHEDPLPPLSPAADDF
jgi:hypothetical protein